MGDCQVLAAFLLTPKATFRGICTVIFVIESKNEGNPKPEPKKDATEMLYRWLQVKLFHFSATSQASLSNLDEEEYFNNIEKSLSPVSFTIYFNVMLIECILTLYYLYSVNKSLSRKYILFIQTI
ncbi:hypothetical protein Avbf_11587 [Armadillidium vulgare]|nr:hypothetical protein Avbf_17909 [Armadillidium vulgare]RXG51384.1 hypothetical protein Avbf_17982 [Armadillidium vulgare]RXG51986.1 hypothetical protein Avbf_02037 [Armadillidium vulgare]RXG54678.1 hypothetical protein Avbf_18232 [Armadillidium vulgare]RXG57988.1 hypothetical protein Avbf_11185 [Armadillidium vulgare]